MAIATLEVLVLRTKTWAPRRGCPTRVVGGGFVSPPTISKEGSVLENIEHVSDMHEEKAEMGGTHVGLTTASH